MISFGGQELFQIFFGHYRTWVVEGTCSNVSLWICLCSVFSCRFCCAGRGNCPTPPKNPMVCPLGCIWFTCSYIYQWHSGEAYMKVQCTLTVCGQVNTCSCSIEKVSWHTKLKVQEEGGTWILTEEMFITWTEFLKTNLTGRFFQVTRLVTNLLGWAAVFHRNLL